MAFCRKAGSNKWTFTHEDWIVEVEPDGKIKAHWKKENNDSSSLHSYYAEVSVESKGITIVGTTVHSHDGTGTFIPVVPWEVIKAIMIARDWDY